MIATRILKIHAEVAEIIETKVCTYKIDIFFCHGIIAKQKNLNEGCQLWPQLSQPFLHGFSKFLWLSCSKFSEFFKTPPTFTFRISFVREKCQKQSVDGLRGCSQMTSAFFGVSDTLWCLCQPIIRFWHAPWCSKLTKTFVNTTDVTEYVLQKGSSWA